MKWVISLFLATIAKSALSYDPGLSSIDELRYHTLWTINSLWDNIKESNDINGAPTMTDEQLLQQFRVLGRNISQTENTVEPEGLNHLIMLLSYSQIEVEVNNMNAIYNAFRRFQKEQIRTKKKLAFTDFASFILDKTQNGVNSTLNKIHTFTLPKRDDSIFSAAIEESKSTVCEMEQSQQQVIYNLYNMISLSELKGYTMLNFAWMLLKLYDKGNFTTEADLLKKLYMQRTLQKVNAAREAMAKADRSLFRCDPRQWKEGENFVKLTKLLQGYIENEVNLNSEGTCRENCDYYQVAKYHGCFKDQFCSKQPPCHGSVVKCTYVDSDMDICTSSSEDRRYDWVSYENRRVLGNKGTCKARNTFKVDSWWRYLFWHCSYCFCLCDDNYSGSDRYFNLRDVRSDIKANKVVTGLRIVKEKQVIHLQIQQALLEERGVVNRISQEWVAVPSYSILDHDIENGRDYHTMSWRERGVDLDDVKAPEGHVLTGVRFRKLGPHINLEILSTPFDFSTGKLTSEMESVWLGNDNTDGSLSSPRSEILLYNPDVPTKVSTNVPDSKHDQFINFRESSMAHDAGQTTIPFLDSQPLDSKGLILSGAGLHHRGTLNSGGLIAPKIITYDFSKHMTPQEPDNIS